MLDYYRKVTPLFFPLDMENTILEVYSRTINKNVVLTATNVIDHFNPIASLSFALASQNVSKAAPHYATKPRAFWLSL